MWSRAVVTDAFLRSVVKDVSVNRNDRAITGLVMLAHSLVHTYELAFPVLIPIWLAEFDTTAALIGLVVTIGLSLFGLGSLPAGVLADRRGSQPLIVVCLLGMGTAFLLVSAAPNLVVLTLALVVWGAAASVYHPAGLSLITKGVEERGNAFAYHGTAGNVGTAAGPLLVTVLLFALGGDWRIAAAVLAIPALAGAVVAVRVNIEESAALAPTTANGGTRTDGGAGGTDGSARTDDGTGDKDDDADTGGCGDVADGENAGGGGSKASPGVDSFADFVSTSGTLLTGAFVVVFAAVMLSGLYYRGVLTFLPALLSGFETIGPVSLAGRTIESGRVIFTGLLAVGVLGQFTGGKLTDRVPVELGLVVGYGALAVVALGYVPAANAGLVPILVLSAVLGFVLFFVQPFYQATVAEYSPPEARGLSYGYTYLGVFGVGALGASIAGAILTYFSRFALFVALAAFALGASGLAAVLYARGR
jgi:MFS family permease